MSDKRTEYASISDLGPPPSYEESSKNLIGKNNEIHEFHEIQNLDSTIRLNIPVANPESEVQSLLSDYYQDRYLRLSNIDISRESPSVVNIRPIQSISRVDIIPIEEPQQEMHHTNIPSRDPSEIVHIDDIGRMYTCQIIILIILILTALLLIFLIYAIHLLN